MDPWEDRYRAALADEDLRAGLLGFQRSWRDARDERFDELAAATGLGFQPLRTEFAEAKRAVRADLDRLASEFEAAAVAAGAVVARAPDAASARDYVTELCTSRGIDLVVKGKTMVSEEIFLNDHLAEHGITAIETDLGEWLLQLAHEHPSHLVLPAIHKRRGRIAELLTRTLGRTFDPDDVEAMVHAVRVELRERFLTAGMGLTGANALVASTGTVAIVTNEGNERLTTGLPPVHVVLVGLDKLVADHATAMTQLRLLARSATGQAITTYTTFLSGPRPGAELHLVLVDNGRSAMATDPTFDSALSCIRCGACADVCPPYQVVGGHGFGHVYAGAIGLVNTSFHHGPDVIDGPQSLCVSCGACTTVCPAEIPLADQILQVRARQVERRGLPLGARAGLWVLRSRTRTALATAAAAAVTRPWRRDGVSTVPLPRRHRWRRPPVLSMRPARARRDQLAPPSTDGPLAGAPITLFLQCLSDRVAPDIALDAERVLRRLGADVHVPPAQHCCGLPAFDLGDLPTARDMARRTIAALEPSPGRVVTPASSCVAAIVHEYPTLLADDPAWAARATRLAERTATLTAVVDEVGLGRDDETDLGTVSIAVHRFCQSTNVLGADDVVERVVTAATGSACTPLEECTTCCGFGGSTSVLRPEVARGILERKLDAVRRSGADVLVTDNPGCVLHLRGGTAAAGLDVEVLHVAELLARGLPDA